MLQGKHLQVVLLSRENGEANGHVHHYQAAQKLNQQHWYGIFLARSKGSSNAICCLL